MTTPLLLGIVYMFGAAPHVAWMDGLDKICSAEYAGRGHMRFVVEPCYVSELFALRDKMQEWARTVGVPYRPVRFVKLAQPSVIVCSHCYQLGHTKQKCGHVLRDVDMHERAGLHDHEHGAVARSSAPACLVCHQFHSGPYPSNVVRDNRHVPSVDPPSIK